MKNIFQKYFIHRTDTTHIQFFRYLFVGGISTLVDMSIFYAINNIIYLNHYLVAQTAGFILGLSINYLLSIIWVFESTGNMKKEFILFALIGIIGLILSYLVLWLLIDIANLRFFQDMLAKSIATLTVLAWNFSMRKKLVFNQ